MVLGPVTQVNTKEYLSKGKDGYTAFLGAKMLRSGEEAPIIPTTMRNHLLTLDVLNVMGGGGGGGDDREDIHLRVANSFKAKSKTVMARTLLAAAEAQAAGEGEGAAPISPLAGKNPATGKLCLAPCVDGRIVTLNPADESQMQ